MTLATLIEAIDPQLILYMPHVIFDGMSFAFLSRDLLSLLAQPDLTLPPLPVTEHLMNAISAKIAKQIPITAGKFVLLTEYCREASHVADFYARATQHGFVAYATSRALDSIVINPRFAPD